MAKLSPVRTGVSITICLAACLALASCSNLETVRQMPPLRLQAAETRQFPYNVEKCLLDVTSGTYYLWEENRPEIHFLRDSRQLNLIGGLGTDKGNFQRLSDIALDPTGNLLALDSFARRVSKFNPDGKWVADIELQGMNQPSRLCSTPEGDLIVFDAAVQELVKISGFDGTRLYRFGRFEVQNATNLTAGRDYVAIYDAAAGLTSVFTSLGQHVRDHQGQVVLDQFQNFYSYGDGILRYLDTDILLPLGWNAAETNLFAAPVALLLVKRNEVLTVMPAYRED